MNQNEIRTRIKTVGTLISEERDMSTLVALNRCLEVLLERLEWEEVGERLQEQTPCGSPKCQP